MRWAEAKYRSKLPEPKKYRKSWYYYYPVEWDDGYPRYNPYRSSRAQMFAEYPVPNFGVDSDILDTQRSIKQAEKLRGRKLKDPAAGGKTWNYDVNGDYENRRGFEPAFRAQTDSQSFAQADSEREPLLSNIKHYSNLP